METRHQIIILLLVVVAGGLLYMILSGKNCSCMMEGFAKKHHAKKKKEHEEEGKNHHHHPKTHPKAHPKKQRRIKVEAGKVAEEVVREAEAEVIRVEEVAKGEVSKVDNNRDKDKVIVLKDKLRIKMEIVPPQAMLSRLVPNNVWESAKTMMSVWLGVSKNVYKRIMLKLGSNKSNHTLGLNLPKPKVLGFFNTIS